MHILTRLTWNIVIQFNSSFFSKFLNFCLELQTPCSKNPCLNEGTCINFGETFKCVCKHGYNGSTCEGALTAEIIQQFNKTRPKTVNYRREHNFPQLTVFDLFSNSDDKLWDFIFATVLTGITQPATDIPFWKISHLLVGAIIPLFIDFMQGQKVLHPFYVLTNFDESLREEHSDIYSEQRFR